jgi:hypothetical protein
VGFLYIYMEYVYRKASSMVNKGFKKENSYLKENSHDIIRKLAELGVEDDILIQTAFEVGGIINNPILRIYAKVGDEEVSQKMRVLVEEALFKKTIEHLKHFYV